MIDIHSHILPGLDDGAISLDVTTEMLDAMARLGFDTVVATPHLAGPLDEAYDEAVTRALETVRPLAAARGIELVRGFEVRLSPDLPARLRAGEPITLGESTAVLVDLPLGAWPWDLDEALYNVQASGFQPVLAHPERYPLMQRRPRYARELADRGVTLQLTIATFAGAFGRRVQRTAEALLREDAVHLIATDAHSPGDRLAAVSAGLKRLELLTNPQSIHQLAAINPPTLLRGDLPAPVRDSPRGLRRFIPAFGQASR